MARPASSPTTRLAAARAAPQPIGAVRDPRRRDRLPSRPRRPTLVVPASPPAGRSPVRRRGRLRGGARAVAASLADRRVPASGPVVRAGPASLGRRRQLGGDAAPDGVVGSLPAGIRQRSGGEAQRCGAAAPPTRSTRRILDVGGDGRRRAVSPRARSTSSSSVGCDTFHLLQSGPSARCSPRRTWLFTVPSGMSSACGRCHRACGPRRKPFGARSLADRPCAPARGRAAVVRPSRSRAMVDGSVTTSDASACRLRWVR